MTKMIIYPNIEAERARLGLSQEEFSQIIGLTRRTYSAYIRGKGAFNSKALIKLSEITNTSTDYLLGLNKSHSTTPNS